MQLDLDLTSSYVTSESRMQNPTCVYKSGTEANNKLQINLETFYRGKVQAGAVVAAKLCRQKCCNRDHCMMESYLNRLHNVGEQL